MKTNLRLKKGVSIVCIILATCFLIGGFITKNIAVTVIALVIAVITQKKSYHLLFAEYDEKIKLKHDKYLRKKVDYE